MKPRVAYIDYKLNEHRDFETELKNRGIDVVSAETMEEFQDINFEKNPINKFPVIIYHPGVEQQNLLVAATKLYPKTKFIGVAMVPQDYLKKDKPAEYKKSAIDIFSYDSIDSIVECIKANQ